MRLNLCSMLVGLAALVAVIPLQAAEVEEPDFPDALVDAGGEYFIANCAFCHGRDAQGGSRGLDLTRSELMAGDEAGDLIGPVVRAGRVDKGMPAFATISAPELEAVSAFIHVQRHIAETADGGRRSVSPEDLATGDAVRGERYFRDNCVQCHQSGGGADLAGISDRFQGLGLLMRMLNPASGRGTPVQQPVLAVVTQSGERFVGELAYRDEFTVAMRDSAGVYRSWSTGSIEFSVEDPLEAHIDQLARYSDEDMHDVYAFLLTL